MCFVIMQIILATSSPYRRDAFKEIISNFITNSSNVDENFEGRPENPEELQLRNTR